VALTGVQHPSALIGDLPPLAVADRLTKLDSGSSKLAQHRAELLLVRQAGASHDGVEEVPAVCPAGLVLRLVGDLEGDEALARRQAGRETVREPAAQLVSHQHFTAAPGAGTRMAVAMPWGLR
jgi:hypothetical protein